MENAIAVIIGIAIGALSMYLFRPSKGHPDFEKLKPKGAKPSSDGQKLNDLWTAKRKAANDKAAGKVDNRSAWWSVEDIQNYIAFAENQVGQMGYTMDGIRIFLGVYPGNSANDRDDYTTMFMAPTGKKGGSTTQAGAQSPTIEGADVLNDSPTGHPPGSGYP